MGRSKQTTNETQQSQTRYTPTPEETRYNQLQLGQMEDFDPIQRELNKRGGNLINRLLGGESLPGYLAPLPGGISDEVTNEIVQESIRDLQPQFQRSGLLDSGVNVAASARVAGDIRRSREEFNIGNLLNLLNLAVGGQAQVQQPIISQGALLSQRLSGLRTIDQTGYGSSSVMYNPFREAFMKSSGSMFGNPPEAIAKIAMARGGGGFTTP